MRIALVLALLGCAAPQPQVGDTGARDDAAAVGDAGVDAYAAPEHDAAAPQVDAWSSPDTSAPDAWSACDLYTNTGCDTAHTCRPTAGPHEPFDGPVMCEPDGVIFEGRTGCSPTDLCGHGLFCETGSECVRPCVMGSTCPPLEDGTAQSCRISGPDDAYHCSARF